MIRLITNPIGPVIPIIANPTLVKIDTVMAMTPPTLSNAPPNRSSPSLINSPTEVPAFPIELIKESHAADILSPIALPNSAATSPAFWSHSQNSFSFSTVHSRATAKPAFKVATNLSMKFLNVSDLV